MPSNQVRCDEHPLNKTQWWKIVLSKKSGSGGNKSNQKKNRNGLMQRKIGSKREQKHCLFLMLTNGREQKEVQLSDCVAIVTMIGWC